MPTTYGNDIVYCLKSHCGVRGYCRQKWVLQVQIICKFSNERTCKRNKDVQGLSCGFEDILKVLIMPTAFQVLRLFFIYYKVNKDKIPLNDKSITFSPVFLPAPFVIESAKIFINDLKVI